MGEVEMGRVCPPVTLTMVMMEVVLGIRDGSWWPSGRGEREAKAVGG